MKHCSYYWEDACFADEFSSGRYQFLAKSTDELLYSNGFRWTFQGLEEFCAHYDKSDTRVCVLYMNKYGEQYADLVPIWTLNGFKDTLGGDIDNLEGIFDISDLKKID